MNRPARLLRNRLERALEHIEDVERHLKRYPNDFHRLDRGTADGQVFTPSRVNPLLLTPTFYAQTTKAA